MGASSTYLKFDLSARALYRVPLESPVTVSGRCVSKTTDWVQQSADSRTNSLLSYSGQIPYQCNALNPEIFELNVGIEEPFKIWDHETISTGQICGFALIWLQISGILICARSFQVSGLKESTISSNVTRSNLEISKLKQGIDKPFEISQLYVISNGQICCFGLIPISVGSSSSEIRPDRNLSEFRSKAASRIADLAERGGPYM